jgi:hypothetical protein
VSRQGVKLSVMWDFVISDPFTEEDRPRTATHAVHVNPRQYIFNELPGFNQIPSAYSHGQSPMLPHSHILHREKQ